MEVVSMAKTRKVIREIILDTETTGFSPEEGERLVEIGAIELINHIPTGVQYHQYINPEKEISEEITQIHGLTYDFLKAYPTFKDIAQNLLNFISEDSKIIAHIAKFDMKFINYELKKSGYKSIRKSRVIDTLGIARAKFPGQRINLSSLYEKLDVDASERVLHGALLDAKLLSEVYIKLLQL